MGSTDIWKPLHCLQLLSDEDASMVGTDITTLPPRSIFLVSDGHMTEEGPTLDAIRRGIRHSRLFTFGVRCVCGERKRERGISNGFISLEQLCSQQTLSPFNGPSRGWL